MTKTTTQYDEEWFLKPDAPQAPTIYNYNPITGEYVGDGKPEPSPREYGVWLYPAYSTTIKPLKHKQGKAIMWSNDAWQYVDDFRGQTWFDNNGNEIIIAELGNPKDQGLLKDKPQTPDIEPVIPPLTARQFWQAALVIGVTEENLTQEISDPKNAMYIADDAERESVLIDIKKATQFERNHYLIENLTTAKNIPTEQLDSLWQWASQIK